jgi:hypothetical protein
MERIKYANQFNAEKNMNIFLSSTTTSTLTLTLTCIRRSTFENANILIILNKRELIADDILEDLLDRLDHLCRKTTNFQKALQ